MNAAQYFELLESEFAKASQLSPVLKRTIDIGDYHVAMEFCGPALISVFYDAFRHLAVNLKREDCLHLTLHFWSGHLPGGFSGNVPWNNEDEDPLGFVASFSCDGYFTLRQPGSGAIYMLDSKSGNFYYWISDPALMPWWESDFPLRMVFHWWFKDFPLQPVHAAAVGNENGGVLLVGKGGSGKSTTALACIHSNLKLAGDDYVLLDCSNATAYSLFSLSKLTEGSLDLLKNISVDRSALTILPGDKFRINLFPEFKKSLIPSIKINAVLLPSVSNNKNTTITEASAGEVMMALAPTTLLQLPGLREEAFAKMSAFVKSVRGYHLLLGQNTAELPVILEEFILSHSQLVSH